MTDRQITHAPDCWSWGPAHYECAVRAMYDAIQEVKRQDAWGNARLTEALMAAEERAERAEAENRRLLEERDALLAALEKARAFIGGQPVRTETVGKSVYLREECGKVMRVMSTIDAAIERAREERDAPKAENARLREALDELREALQAIVDEVSDGLIPYSSDSYLPAHLVEQARAAIDAATKNEGSVFRTGAA